ncbi:aldose 1-epimerase family protein [Tsuneonella sp. HG222]
MTQFSITSGELSATIDSFGAELVSLTDARGREYLTDGDPRWWSGHAPVLFPIVGRLRGDTLRLDGREYRLEKHGFARRAEFAMVDMAADRAVFRLRDSAATRESYPFAFELEMAFALAGTTLAMTATVTNPGDAPLPFSFGFHPAFAWPLPGGAAKGAHRVVFERNEPQGVKRIGPDGLLLPGAEPTPVEGNVLAPAATMFEADALIWTGLASRACRYGAEDGAWLDLAFPDCPHLGIWQKPGAPFLAIEPWHGFNDPADFAGDFRAKPGVAMLEPGAARAFRMDVAVHPA